MAERGYKNIATVGEDVTEFSYRPRNCKRDYRVVALRKDLKVTGQGVLFNEFRYFFYITNDRRLTADQVVAEARHRCDQENLIAQLKASPGPARPGQHPRRQPGLHDHGRSGLDPQGLDRPAVARPSPLGRHPQRAAPPSAGHGVPHLRRRCHQHPLPDRHAPAARSAGASSPTTPGSAACSDSPTASKAHLRCPTARRNYTRPASARLPHRRNDPFRRPQSHPAPSNIPITTTRHHKTLTSRLTRPPFHPPQTRTLDLGLVHLSRLRV